MESKLEFVDNVKFFVILLLTGLLPLLCNYLPGNIDTPSQSSGGTFVQDVGVPSQEDSAHESTLPKWYFVHKNTIVICFNLIQSADKTILDRLINTGFIIKEKIHEPFKNKIIEYYIVGK